LPPEEIFRTGESGQWKAADKPNSSKASSNFKEHLEISQ